MNAADVRTVDSLARLLESGHPVEFLFFNGHKVRDAEQLDANCLSNWYPAPFSLDGMEYQTTEHFMMAEKARLFDDEWMWQRILDADTPSEAKKLGRQISGFVEREWNQYRFDIVVSGNAEKFRQNPALGMFLLETADRVIVEASPRDQIWGIGMGENHTKARNPRQWNGLNLLGFALMEVRTRLKAEGFLRGN